MSGKRIGLILAMAALVGLGGACSEHRQEKLNRQWHDITRTPEHQFELNTASRSQLATLPGLTDNDADRIIANRPYGDKQGLLRKKVIGQKKYDKIEDYVYVSQTR